MATKRKSKAGPKEALIKEDLPSTATTSEPTQPLKRPPVFDPPLVPPPTTGSELRFMFHLLALAAFVRVWLWHCSPAASFLPGATGFGWFFRYLTFYSFTLQMAQFGLCCVAHLQRHPLKRQVLVEWADDVSCALFGLANVVTVMYYLLDAATQSKGLIEGGMEKRPVWLGWSVHVFNSLVAWCDIMISHPRTFSRRAEWMSIGVVGFYSAWLLLCGIVNGAFPYPFMNAMPWPHGYIATVTAGVVCFVILFKLGRAISTPLRALRVTIFG